MALIVLAVFVVGLIGGVLLIIFGLIGRKAGPAGLGLGGGGACGACGYPVTGLESLTCPECGADLRQVGIVKAGARNTGANIMLVMGIVLVSLVVMCCAGGFLLTGAWTMTVHTVPTVQQAAPAQPAPAPPAP